MRTCIDPISGNHLFGKETCPHCKRAKGYLEHAGIAFTYHDVVSSPRALYEMLGRVKEHVEPNLERGQCSLSPPRSS